MDAYLFLFAALNSVLALATWVSFSSGAMNLAVAGFYSIGGYVAALVSTRFLDGQHVFVQLFSSIVLALIVSVPVSFAICRFTGKLRGIFFALATLSFLEFLRVLCLNFDFLGGAVGIFGIPPLAQSEAAVALWIGGWTCIAFVVCLLFRASVLGKSSEMVRLNEFAAQSVGLNIAVVHMQGALLSCSLASVTGVFAAHALGTWNSRQGSFDTAVMLVACAVLGGTRNPVGTLVAAVLLNLIPEYLRDLGDWRLVFMGVFLVAGCVFLPDGISAARIFLPKNAKPQQRKTEILYGDPSKNGEHLHACARQILLNDDEPLFKVTDLSVKFGGLQALSHVSFEVRSGEIFGVIGPNGAGKTTLMNAVSGFVPIQSGTIWLGTREISSLPAYKRARCGLGRSFQNLRLMDQLSVLENLWAAMLCSSKFLTKKLENRGEATGCSVNKKSTQKMLSTMSFEGFELGSKHNLLGACRDRELQHALFFLELFKIEHLAHKSAGTLSYGDKRKVEIARALLLNPLLLVLDEPAAGLNTAEKKELSLVLQQIVAMSHARTMEQSFGLAQNPLTLVVIEHDLPLIETICERVLVLQHGHVIALGATRETLLSEKVQTAYLGSVYEV